MTSVEPWQDCTYSYLVKSVTRKLTEVFGSKLANSLLLFSRHCLEKNTPNAEEWERTCRRMTPIELICILHLKATMLNMHIAVKNSKQCWCTQEFKFLSVCLQCTPLCCRCNATFKSNRRRFFRFSRVIRDTRGPQIDVGRCSFFGGGGFKCLQLPVTQHYSLHLGFFLCFMCLHTCAFILCHNKSIHP